MRLKEIAKSIFIFVGFISVIIIYVICCNFNNPNTDITLLQSLKKCQLWFIILIFCFLGCVIIEYIENKKWRN
jgi:phage shock protein PspC (stress-responsive transcriptional regulator)